jgi:mannose-6-phosphate isomerase-like protein (cupin superfamily)
MVEWRASTLIVFAAFGLGAAAHLQAREFDPAALWPARGSDPAAFLRARGSDPAALLQARGPDPVALWRARGPEPAALAPVLEPDPARLRGELASQVLPIARAELAAKGAFGEFRKQLNGETRSLQELLSGVAVIEPGQEIHPPHQHAEEEFLYLAKGEGTWHLDGKESRAREGDLLYVAPWVVHGLKNTSKRPLTFFVVKWNGRGLPVPAKPPATEGKSAGANADPTGAGLPPAAGIRGELASEIRRRDDVTPEVGPIGDLRRYWNGAATRSLRDLVTGVAVLNPGQEVHPPHQHAEEEFIYLVQGRGTWHLDGKDLPAAEGDLLFTAPWVMHGLKNTGNEALTFFIVKWNAAALPLPEKPARR